MPSLSIYAYFIICILTHLPTYMSIVSFPSKPICSLLLPKYPSTIIYLLYNYTPNTDTHIRYLCIPCWSPWFYGQGTRLLKLYSLAAPRGGKGHVCQHKQSHSTRCETIYIKIFQTTHFAISTNIKPFNLGRHRAWHCKMLPQISSFHHHSKIACCALPWSIASYLSVVRIWTPWILRDGRRSTGC